jgi:hypothetical protein
LLSKAFLSSSSSAPPRNDQGDNFLKAPKDGCNSTVSKCPQQQVGAQHDKDYYCEWYERNTIPEH